MSRIYTIKPIETQYKGYRFRSRLEAKWAVFLDACGEEWDYEKEGYELPSGRYLPDFWLPRLQCWLEVKPPGKPTLHEYHLCGELGDATGYVVILADGLPEPIPDIIYGGNLIDNSRIPVPNPWFQTTVRGVPCIIPSDTGSGVMVYCLCNYARDDEPDDELDEPVSCYPGLEHLFSPLLQPSKGSWYDLAQFALAADDRLCLVSREYDCWSNCSTIFRHPSGVLFKHMKWLSEIGNLDLSTAINEAKSARFGD